MYLPRKSIFFMIFYKKSFIIKKYPYLCNPILEENKILKKIYYEQKNVSTFEQKKSKQAWI